MMVFLKKNLNDTGEVLVYGTYHKYWLDHSNRITNPDFDDLSGKILDLKDINENAIKYFFDILDKAIAKDITICVVPSHISNPSEDSGIKLLAKKLAKNGRVDKTDFLIRRYTIDKLAHGGNRDYFIQRNSITVSSSDTIQGEVILLIDDVTTTGHSLLACKDILLENGASKVEMFAIGSAGDLNVNRIRF